MALNFHYCWTLPERDHFRCPLCGAREHTVSGRCSVPNYRHGPLPDTLSPSHTLIQHLPPPPWFAFLFCFVLFLLCLSYFVTPLPLLA